MKTTPLVLSAADIDMLERMSQSNRPFAAVVPRHTTPLPPALEPSGSKVTQNLSPVARSGVVLTQPVAGLSAWAEPLLRGEDARWPDLVRRIRLRPEAPVLPLGTREFYRANDLHGEVRAHLLEMLVQGTLALARGEDQEPMAKAMYDGIADTAIRHHIDIRDVLFTGSSHDPFCALLGGQRMSRGLFDDLMQKMYVGLSVPPKYSPGFCSYNMTTMPIFLKKEVIPRLQGLLADDVTEKNPLVDEHISMVLGVPRRLGSEAYKAQFGESCVDLSKYLSTPNNLLRASHLHGAYHWRNLLAEACPALCRDLHAELGQQLEAAKQAGDRSQQDSLLGHLVDLSRLGLKD